MTEKNTLVFVTGNANKAAEAVAIWAALGVRIEVCDAIFDEIQSYSLEEVVRAKAMRAFGILRTPLLVEDVALDVDALGGFPGPFVKFWQKGPGYDELWKIVKARCIDRAFARCGMAYTDGERTEYVEGRREGRIVIRRGDKAFGFDPYFVPKSHSNAKTFAELGQREKNLLSHRTAAIIEMCERLRSADIIRPDTVTGGGD